MAEFNDDDTNLTGGGDESYIDPDEPTSEIDEPEDEPKKKRIQPWMIIVGSMLAAGVVGMGIKSMKGGQESVHDVQPLPPPQVTIQPMQPVQPVQPAPTEVVSATPIMPGDATTSPVSGSATPSPTSVATADPKADTSHATDEITGVKSQISDLGDRLSALERKVDQIGTRKTVVPSSTKTHRASKPANPKGESKSAKQEATVEAKPEGKTDSKETPTAPLGASKYRIKAIPSTFQDQAWVEDGEGNVTVVNVGDTFAGMKILSIDADHFEVKTDKGVIR